MKPKVCTERSWVTATDKHECTLCETIMDCAQMRVDNRWDMKQGVQDKTKRRSRSNESVCALGLGVRV